MNSIRIGHLAAISGIVLSAGATFAQTATSPTATPMAKQEGTPAKVAPATPSTATSPAAATPAVVSSGDPRRDTLNKFLRPITVSMSETRLEDVMKFIIETTGADVDVLWMDDKSTSGLDKETPITIDVKGRAALDFLEAVLLKASQSSGGSPGDVSTWQMTQYGTMQVGTKTRLNTFKRLEIYDVADLLFENPDYTQAPEFDLQQVLQNSGGRGGGGGQSPFQNANEGNNQQDAKPLNERLAEVRRLITTIVEPEQWIDGGGDGGSIQEFQRSLIVNAPDYMHRQLNGYSYWSRGTTVTRSSGRRYVTLTTDNALSTLRSLNTGPNGIQNPTITATEVQTTVTAPGSPQAPAPKKTPGGG